MRLGFAVKILGDTQPTSSAGTGGGLPTHDARRWQSGPQDGDGGAQAARRALGLERSWVLPQLRAHEDVIDPIAFEHFLRETAAGLDFDVMLEAKAKDLALLRLRAQLAGRGLATVRS